MLQVSEKGLREVMRAIWGFNHDEQTAELDALIAKGDLVPINGSEYMMNWVEFYHMDTSFLKQLSALSNITPEMEEDIYNTVDLFFLDETFHYLEECDDEFGDAYREAYRLFRNPYYNKCTDTYLYQHVKMVQLAAASCVWGDFPMSWSLCKSLSTIQGDSK